MGAVNSETQEISGAVVPHAAVDADAAQRVLVGLSKVMSTVSSTVAV